MTVGEVQRAISSRNRVVRNEAREKASYDYILADMIGKSVSRIYSSSNKMPEISEIYPSLFDSKEVEEQRAVRKAELSALRFKQYADFHNKKFKEGEKD